MVMIALFQKAHALDFFYSVYFLINKKLSIKFKIFSSPVSLYLYFFSIQVCDIICILLIETVILNLSSIFKTFRLGYQGTSSRPEMILITDCFSSAYHVEITLNILSICCSFISY